MNIDKTEFENVPIIVILIIISGTRDMKYYINNLLSLDFDEHSKNNCNATYIRAIIEHFHMLTKTGPPMSDLTNV